MGTGAPDTFRAVLAHFVMLEGHSGKFLVNWAHKKKEGGRT
jgi:hypothetical protein